MVEHLRKREKYEVEIMDQSPTSKDFISVYLVAFVLNFALFLRVCVCVIHIV